MGWLSVAAVLVAGCDKGASTRLYTDDEIAALEAKARPHADPSARGLPTINILSLQPLARVLGDVRKEPDASLAAKKAVAQFQWVRDLTKDERSSVRLYVTESGEWLIADALDELLSSGRLSGPDLDALAAAIDQVLATEVRVGAILEGEIRLERSIVLYNDPIATTGGHDPKDERALELAVVDELEPLITAACSPTASLAECHRKLPQASDRHDFAGIVLDRNADAIRGADTSTRHKLQAQITHEVAMIQIDGYRDRVVRAAQAVTRLVALRIEIAVARGGDCDAVQFLQFAPAMLGEPVIATQVGTSLHVAPPTWAALGRNRNPHVMVANPPAGAELESHLRYGDHWEIQCPQ